MAKLEVTKSIEARMLNKRNRQMLSQPPVTIPYGAILEDVVENRDMIEFNYVGELYSCKAEVLRPASHPLDGGPPLAASASGSASAPAPSAPPVTFVWEKLQSGGIATSRAKLPGGWLIAVGDSRSVAFYPDPSHSWDGRTLP